MSTKFASRQTEQTFTVTGTNGEVTVVSGNAVQVCGMHFTGDATDPTVFTVRNGAGTATLFTVNVLADDSYNLQTSWLADVGLRVQCDKTGGASVVVFHNSPGV